MSTGLPVSLEDFIEGPDKARLGFKIDRPGRLLKSLFGDRIEATAPLVLSMDRNLAWAIDAVVRHPYADEKAAATALPRKRKGRLFILDIPLEFGGVKLARIRSDRANADEQRVAAPEGQTPSGSSSDKPALKDQPAEKTPAPEANTERRLFEAEVIYGRPAKWVGKPGVKPGGKPGEKPDEGGPDGLYGTIYDISGFTVANKNPRDLEDVLQVWGFDFATKRLALGDAVVDVALDEEAFTPDRTGMRKHSEVKAAIRHWGYPDYTVAGCSVAPVDGRRSIGRLRLRQDAPGQKIEEGPFEFCAFEIVRQRRVQDNAPGRGYYAIVCPACRQGRRRRPAARQFVRRRTAGRERKTRCVP
jgi:hypothetical protein